MDKETTQKENMKEILQEAITLLMGHADGDFVSKKDALRAATTLHNLMIKTDHYWYFIEHVLNEVARAEEKHPNWPDNVAYGILIVGEEYGEAMREAVKIQMKEPDKSLPNLKKKVGSHNGYLL